MFVVKVLLKEIEERNALQIFSELSIFAFRISFTLIVLPSLAKGSPGSLEPMKIKFVQ